MKKENLLITYQSLWVSGKDHCTCKVRPEALTTGSYDILYLFGQGNINFIREKLGSFEKWCLWQILFVCMAYTYHYSVISFVGKVPLGTSMRDAEKLYSECADQ